MWFILAICIHKKTGTLYPRAPLLSLYDHIKTHLTYMFDKPTIYNYISPLPVVWFLGSPVSMMLSMFFPK